MDEVRFAAATLMGADATEVQLSTESPLGSFSDGD